MGDKIKLVFAMFMFSIISILITWPLVLNMNGFLLTPEYPDISHSDAPVHIEHMQQTRLSLLNKTGIVINPGFGNAQTYALSGAFITFVFDVKDVMFHNLYLLGSIFLAGIFMFLLVYELFKDYYTAMFSGIIFITSNFFVQQYVWGHANTWQIQWIPLTFLFLERTLKNKKIQDSLLLGIALALQLLSSTQIIVYLSVLIPLYLLSRYLFVEKNKLLDKKIIVRFIVSGCIALVLSGFYLIKRISLPHSIRLIESTYIYSWGLTKLHPITEYLSVNSNIYIGLVQFILVLVSICLILKNIKSYRQFLSYVILGICLVVLLMGPVYKFLPYFWLYHLWPFFKHFIVIEYFFPYLLMCISILSGFPFYYLKQKKVKEKHRILVIVMIVLLIISTQIIKSVWLTQHHIYFP